MGAPHVFEQLVGQDFLENLDLTTLRSVFTWRAWRGVTPHFYHPLPYAEAYVETEMDQEIRAFLERVRGLGGGAAWDALDVARTGEHYELVVRGGGREFVAITRVGEQDWDGSELIVLCDELLAARGDPRRVDTGWGRAPRSSLDLGPFILCATPDDATTFVRWGGVLRGGSTSA